MLANVTTDGTTAQMSHADWLKVEDRLAKLEAALRKINALIDDPSRFNSKVQAVLDSVIDTADVKFGS